jgi:hypothetical protein
MSLLEQLDLTAIYGRLEMSSIDYDVVRRTLGDLREESLRLLNTALNGVEQRRHGTASEAT